MGCGDVFRRIPDLSPLSTVDALLISLVHPLTEQCRAKAAQAAQAAERSREE